MTIIAFFIFLFLSLHSHHGEYMHTQWLLASIVAVFIIAYKIKQQTSLILSLNFAYLLINLLFTIHLIFGKYARIPSVPRDALSNVSLAGVFYLVLVSMASGCFKLRSEAIFKALYPYNLLNSFYVVCGGIFGFGILFGGVGHSGFINQAGINGLMVASGVGFILMRKNPIEKAFSILLTLCAIYFSRSSIPWGVLAVTVCTYYFAKKRGAIAILTAIVVFAIGWASETTRYLNSAGRFAAYQIFMKEWWNKGWIWTGTGPSTFQKYAAAIQVKHGFSVDTVAGIVHEFTWMHSDLIQHVFENGIIGGILGLMLLVEVFCLLLKKKSSSSSAILAMWVGLIAGAVFDYPVRYAPTAILLSLGLVYAYSKEGVCTQGESNQVGIPHR